MTDRQYKNSPRPESEVYMPMPMDRKLLGQKKVEQLQKQIAQMENDQLQRRQLIEKLTKFEDAQGVKQQRQDHVIDRYSKRNLNGNDNVPKSISPGVRIDNVLAKRTKEYTLKQQEKELETKYLVKERERLQAARDRIREQRRAMLSPAGKPKPINKHQLDVISFLKGLGLYHRVPTPPLTPLPWHRKRRGRKKFLYYPCPLNWSHW